MYVWIPEVHSVFVSVIFHFSFEIASLAEPRESAGWTVYQRAPGIQFPDAPVQGSQARAAMPDFLCGLWGSELRSACLHGKVFTY